LASFVGLWWLRRKGYLEEDEDVVMTEKEGGRKEGEQVVAVLTASDPTALHAYPSRVYSADNVAFTPPLYDVKV